MSEDYKMLQVGTGPNDMTGAQIDQTFSAGRFSVRPTEYNGLVGGVQGGHFAICTNFSNTAAKAAGGSDIFSLRWADPTKMFVLKRFNLSVATTTTYTASIIQDAALYKASGFSVAASGGTAVSAVVGAKMQASRMAASGVMAGGTGLAWISSGDALTAGTRTLDTYPLGYMTWLNPITTVNAPTTQDLFSTSSVYAHPLILGLNEGIVLQTPIGNGQAAGVSKWTIVMEWIETAVF
jgi:hypothetical protein